MPRNPANKRQHGAANERDTRHENGLVGPGKRVVKQKSKTELENEGSSGQAANETVGKRPSSSTKPTSGSATTPTPTSPPPNTSAHTSGATSASARRGPAPAEPSHSASRTEREYQDEAARRARRAADEHRLHHSEPFPGDEHHVPGGHRTIDVNAANNANVHRDTGMVDPNRMSILRSRASLDTLAILILLMQLGPVAMSSVYTAFVCLTFSTRWTTASGYILTEVLDAASTPNMWTLVGLDCFASILFAFLPRQDIIISSAQIIIAMTLGGGASSKARVMHNLTFCCGVMFVSHLHKLPGIRKIPKLKTLLGHSLAAANVTDTATATATALPSGATFHPGRFFEICSNLLAVHIVIQGVARYVKGLYIRKDRTDPRTNAELLSLSSTAADSDTAYDDSDSEADVRRLAARSQAAKQRKRQSARARMDQPIWAALASTKILAMTPDQFEGIGSSPWTRLWAFLYPQKNPPKFTDDPEDVPEIWICYIGPDEICFETSRFPNESVEVDEEDEEDSAADGERAYHTAPFHVKVNGTTWQPTRIIRVEDESSEDDDEDEDEEDDEEEEEEDDDDDDDDDSDSGSDAAIVNDGDDDDDGENMGARWTGDIPGLSPSSTYKCDFVHNQTGEILYSVSVRTTPARIRPAETARAAPAAPPLIPRNRQESAAATLQASLESMAIEVEEKKSRLKAIRKEHTRKVNAVKKEIEKINAAIQSTGSSDDRLRQKIAQNITQTKQAEQAIAELDAKIEEMSAVPESEMAVYRAKQVEFNAAKARHEEAQASFKAYKSAYDQEMKTLEAETQALVKQQTKVAGRLEKAREEGARLKEANARDIGEAERRRQESEAMRKEFAEKEQESAAQLASLRRRLAQVNAENQEMEVWIRDYYESESQQQQHQQQHPYGEPRQRQGQASYQNTAATGSSTWPQYTNAYWSPSNTNATPAMIPGTAPTGINGNHNTNNNSSNNSFMPQLPEYPSSSMPYQQQQQQPGPLQTLPERRRGRASSMHSDVSGLTELHNWDEDDDEDAPFLNGSNLDNHTSNNNNNSFMPLSAESNPWSNPQPQQQPQQQQQQQRSPFSQYQNINNSTTLSQPSTSRLPSAPPGLFAPFPSFQPNPLYRNGGASNNTNIGTTAAAAGGGTGGTSAPLIAPMTMPSSSSSTTRQQRIGEGSGASSSDAFAAFGFGYGYGSGSGSGTGSGSASGGYATGQGTPSGASSVRSGSGSAGSAGSAGGGPRSRPVSRFGSVRDPASPTV